MFALLMGLKTISPEGTPNAARRAKKMGYGNISRDQRVACNQPADRTRAVSLPALTSPILVDQRV